MRLICPNCDAQYEVVDDVIPAEGRDVQCSNCGQTWFQHHPDHMPEEPEAEDAAPDLEPDLEPTEQSPADTEEPDEEPQPKRRELDPSVADILREEAEIENQARASEAEALESQPELGLESAETDGDRRAREARERMARMRGEETAPDKVSETTATAAAIGSRRDLLPDIEEINSTLRSTGDRQSASLTETAVETEEVAQGRSGFRRGFMLVILIAVVLLVIYVFAPDIARAVPQVDPFLSSYVAQIDSARLWLDGQVAAGLTWMDNLTAGESE